MSGRSSISIIIPVLNEQDRLARTLESLRQILNNGMTEIILVDGGSTDETLEVARRFEHLKIIEHGHANRGEQMNAGAAVASCEILLFIHADVLIPAGFVESISEAVLTDEIQGGCFMIRFPSGSGRSLRLVAAGINLRTRLFRTASGDQAIFIRRRVFKELGGYKTIPIMEDIELFNRLKARSSVAILDDKVEISPRRWMKHGIWRTVLLMYAIRIGYWLGLSPVKLRKFFVDVR